jgi:GTP cyclohydrolase-4
MPLPDIQSIAPEVQINLTRVGVTGVKKLVEVSRKGKRPIILISTFDMFVDLPADIKGANLSRNLEAMDEVLGEAIASPIYETEGLCLEVAQRLLQRHEYASRSEVIMRAELVIKKKTPVTKIGCQEVVNIFAEGTVLKGGERRKLIGAEVTGITACPCSQEIIREKIVGELKKINVSDANINAFLSAVPVATHNQRGHGSIAIKTRGDVRVPLEKVIAIIENSMSSQIYELLKRVDEVHVVEKAHATPRFAEDCVRIMAQSVVNEFPGLPDDSVITIKQVNEESIHGHNAFAERIAMVGELRKEMGATSKKCANVPKNSNSKNSR